MTHQLVKRGERTSSIKALLAKGLSDKEICDRINLSRSGMRYHISKLHEQAGLYGTANERRFMIWVITGKTPEA